MYEQAFKKLFSDYSLSFLNPDDIKILPINTDILVCGGGEILNDYFIDKIITIIDKSNYTGTVVGISVGIAFDSIVPTGKLDIFDMIIVRNQTDKVLLQSRLGTPHIYCLPDLIFFSQLIPAVEKRPHLSGVNLGICLSRSIYTL